MTIEVTAKKVEEAIQQGLVQLGASLDEVQVEVLESGGFFRKAKVRLTLERAESENKEKPTVKTETKTAEKQPEQKPEKPKQVVAEKAPEKPAAPKTEKKQEKKQPVKNERPAEKPEKVEKIEKTEKTEKKPHERTEQDKQAAELAFGFVKDVIEKMGFEGSTAEQSADGETISITAPEGDDSLIIGRHGETLAALSFLAETCARAEKCHLKVTVDCNGYRARRAASLSAMARRRADECVKKQRKIKLEPMERVDRRTIHNALTDDNRVTTASEGKEPHRYVVIMPKRENKEF